MSDHDLKWIGMDLDGTIFLNNWSPENPTAEIGKPIQRNVEKLWELVQAGYKIVCHTSRPWSDYVKIERALDAHGIPVKAIVCGKLLAAAYIDDRAIAADEPDWLSHVKHINGED